MNFTTAYNLGTILSGAPSHFGKMTQGKRSIATFSGKSIGKQKKYRLKKSLDVRQSFRWNAVQWENIDTRFRKNSLTPLLDQPKEKLLLVFVILKVFNNKTLNLSHFILSDNLLKYHLSFFEETYQQHGVFPFDKSCKMILFPLGNKVILCALITITKPG